MEMVGIFWQAVWKFLEANRAWQQHFFLSSLSIAMTQWNQSNKHLAMENDRCLMNKQTKLSVFKETIFPGEEGVNRLSEFVFLLSFLMCK